MVLKIVQKYSIIIPETAIDNLARFIGPKVQIHVFKNHTFYVLCREKEDYIGFYLYFDCPSPVTVDYTLTVGTIVRSFAYKYERIDGYGNPQIGRRNVLFKNGLMKADLKIVMEMESVEIEHRMLPNLALLNDEKFKDFIFCVGNQEIKVYKNIIAVASPVFAAMLEPHCKEFKDGKVTIEDFDFAKVKDGVHFMYTKEIAYNLSINELFNLYKFADKYDLVDVGEILEILENRINLTTLDEILNFLKQTSLEKVYQKCVTFFSIDFEKKCQEYKKFDKLDNDFLGDVVKKIRNGKNTVS
uniref:BTB domain-containing protein n=1 Tax=Panagrolaimus sp. JU765 TaxID=591449 RepID=A0AC34QU28_9BILA